MRTCKPCNYTTDEAWRFICPICGGNLENIDYTNENIEPKEVTHDFTSTTIKFISIPKR